MMEYPNVNTSRTGGSNSSTLSGVSMYRHDNSGVGVTESDSTRIPSVYSDSGSSLGRDDGYVSRDSGLDFDSDTNGNKHVDVSVVHDQHMTRFSCHGNKGDADMLEYQGGSPIKWRVQTVKRNTGLDNNRNSVIFRSSMHWEDFFGSSIDLTPTLLGIYDKIASANGNGDTGPSDQSEPEFFHADEFLQDGADDHCHSPKLSPNLNSRHRTRSGTEATVTHSSHSSPWEQTSLSNRLKLKMEAAECDLDNKKRPLSISSMSSSSTSSLPRRRKHSKLCDYPDSNSAGHLDIEKLDNLLYIDDCPEMVEPKTDDEISLYSVEKVKASGDTDSQTSAEQLANSADQAGMVNPALSFHQSDSSLSFTPLNSTNCSTADLSHAADSSYTDLRLDRSQRSPSRSTNSSFKQSGHYVSHVQRVVTELVETERSYVQNLEDIQQEYYQFIVNHPSLKISERQTELLFGNISEILNFSCHFYGELEACDGDPIMVADCFVRNNDGFEVYAEYCTNYPSAVAVLTEVMQDPDLSDVFKQRQQVLGHSLPLGAYLLKPVQRVLKYHLLLQNILKHYKQDEVGHEKLVVALDHMTNMSHHINEMKRKHEHAVRVQEIQSQLEDYYGEDFTRLGELVLEASFRMFGVKSSRQVFLFQKGVIVAKRKEDGMLSCKAYIPCATLMIVESIPKEPLSFQILPFDNPRGALTIHARNLDQKRKWCQEIKRLIVESFSSTIPDSVKDLIIEKLGKSKQEDDFVHGILGHHDMSRSHVSTPEYLEKRMKGRRKSAANLIPEILRGQKTRKLQGRHRNDSSSPKPLSVLDAFNNRDSPKTNEVDHYGYRTSIPSSGKEVSTLPRKFKHSSPSDSYYQRIHDVQSQMPNKRPLSVQRSHSFQSSRERDTPSPNSPYLQDKSQETSSVDNLSHENGQPLRTHSFRVATRISPIRLDSVDPPDSLRSSQSPSRDSKSNSVLMPQVNVDNIPPSVRKSIENLVVGGLVEKENQDNMNGSYLEEMNSGKRGRYSSMPVLNSDLHSPKMNRLHSDKSSYSPNINQTGAPLSKHVDLKPYFNYGRDRIKQISDHGVENNLSRDSKSVNAFHDAFSNLRKSQENLNSQKQFSLTQPKPFTSTLKTSATIMNSHAKLNKANMAERFTLGSLTDLSHLKEDPWVRNKQRSFTESKISQPLGRNNSLRDTKREYSYAEKPMNKQMSRLSMEVSPRHERAHSFTGDDRSFSKDNLDWLVYANRNSIPVTGESLDELTHKSRTLTPPRSMEGNQSQFSGNWQKSESSHLSRYTNPSRLGADDIATGFDSGRENDSSTANSSVSLSATNTSSDTCSSPDILKDSIFDDHSSSEKKGDKFRLHVSRSFSTPECKHVSTRRQLNEDRPASVDVLEDVSAISDSEKLLAEMEHYMKRSSSSSGSLSSVNNKFPTTIPPFEKKTVVAEVRNTNRDSCISNGSASSYESGGNLTDDLHLDDSLVDSIKHKLHTITSRITGKKPVSMSPHIQLSHESSRESTPAGNKHEDHPTKLAHNFSLRQKQGPQNKPPANLSLLLKELEPGGEAIGSRMANADFDDYATFSLPRPNQSLSLTPSGDINIDNSPVKREPKENEKKQILYGRYSNSNLTTPTPPKIAESSLQSQSQSKLSSPVSSLKNLNIQQSDSAFSIQSVEIDSSTSEDSPRGSNQNKGSEPAAVKDSDGSDTFYERRLSEVFSNDDAFRDSAVYCDDVDAPVAPPKQENVEEIVPLKVHIKTYVQQLEERNKLKPPIPVKAKAKEPSANIKQRMESLVANIEQRNRSSSTSRSMSSATSRAHSRSSSRASSEDRHVSGTALHEYMQSKFPMQRSLKEVGTLRTRSHSPDPDRMTSAFSLTRLDQLNTDVDNLVIMKGWVKELIEKFQAEK